MSLFLCLEHLEKVFLGGWGGGEEGNGFGKNM